MLKLVPLHAPRSMLLGLWFGRLVKSGKGMGNGVSRAGRNTDTGGWKVVAWHVLAVMQTVGGQQ